MFARLLGFFIIALSFGQFRATAADLLIKDTAGVVRAISSVEELADVRFEVVDPLGQAAEGVEVVLAASDGVEIRGIARGGVVFFEALPAGAYTVSSALPGITFINISVAPSVVAGAGSLVGAVPFLGGGLGTAAAGVAVVAGGAVAIDQATNGSSGDDTPLSPFD